MLEGKKPCITIKRNRLRKLNAALAKAGYERYDDVTFEKDYEIGTWISEMRNERRIHVQVVDVGSYLEIFAHTEPSVNHDPLGHAIGVFLEAGISFGAGCRKLRADLKRIGFRFK